MARRGSQRAAGRDDDDEESCSCCSVPAIIYPLHCPSNSSRSPKSFCSIEFLSELRGILARA
jgi:hypothetical protein